PIATYLFFFSSRRQHTIAVSAFLLSRSSDLYSIVIGSKHITLNATGGGQKAASGGIQGDVLATDNNTVGMGDAGIKSAIQGSNEIGRASCREMVDICVCVEDVKNEVV